MRKLYPILTVAAALILPGTASAQNNKLIVALPTTPPNVVHMPVLIAKELGLYKKYGLEVSTIQLEGGVYTYRATVAGSADVALAAGAFSIVGRAKGAPTKIILASAPKLEASMVVNKNIKSLEDLKGKRIGIQEPGGFADVLSRDVLRAAKVDPKDVHFVSIASEDVPALVADQVDTAILHVEQEMVARSKVPSLHAIVRMWEIRAEKLEHGVRGDGEDHRPEARRAASLHQGQYRGGAADLHRRSQSLAGHRQIHRAVEGNRQRDARLHDQKLHLGRQ